MQTQVYDILNKLREEIIKHPYCNTVTTGDLSEIDIAKTTIFPLTHIVLGEAIISDRTISFNMNIICSDIVNYEKTENKFDNFYGNDNLQDILNSQLNVLNKAFSSLKRGDLWKDRIQVQDTLSASPFLERYANVLAGWEANVQITLPNSINVC